MVLISITVLSGERLTGADVWDDREPLRVGADASVVEGEWDAVNALATLEQDEALLKDSATGNSLWWKWRAAETGLAEFWVVRSDFDHVLGVGRGATVGSVKWEDINAGFVGLRSARVQAWVTEGVEYVIELDGLNGRSGAAVLGWSVTAKLSPKSTYNQSTLSLQREVDIWTNNVAVVSAANEPAAYVQQVVDLEDQVTPVQSEKYWNWKGGHALWWRLPKPKGEYVFSTGGTAAEHWVTLYRGQGSGSMIQVETRAATDRGVWFRSALNREGDEDYWLVVETRGRPAKVHLNIRPVKMPVNGLFAGRIALSGSEGAVKGTNEDAPSRPESGTPSLGPEKSKNWPGVWYSFRAPVTGAFRFQVRSSNQDLFLHVFRGGNLGGLRDAVESLSFLREVVVNVVEGEDYALFVHGVRGATGDFELSYGRVEQPSNDFLASAYPVTFPTFEIRADTTTATLQLGENGLKSLSKELAGTHSAWFWVNPVVAGDFVVSTRGTEYAHAVDVFSVVGSANGAGLNWSQLRSQTNWVVPQEDLAALAGRDVRVIRMVPSTNYLVRMSSLTGQGGEARLGLFAAGALNVREIELETRGVAQFSLFGIPKTGYSILFSQNLIQWLTLTNVALVGAELDFELAVPKVAPLPAFYRATRYP